MQGWHALALLGTGLWAPRGGRLADAAAVLRTGLLLFCGAVYSLALTGVCSGSWRRPGVSCDAGLAAAGGVRAAWPGDPRRLPGRRGLRDAAGRGIGPPRRAISGWHGRLALSPDPPVQAAWALDIWTDPREIEAPSVKAAADALRAMQRNWAAYAAGHHRRMALIGERLPPVKAAPLVFPAAAPTRIWAPGPCSHRTGCWPARRKIQPVRQWRVPLCRDRIGPPSRAYLKLWEA